MPTHLSTEHIRPDERPAYWNYLVSSVLGQLDTEPFERGAFSGSISYGTVAMMPVAEVASTQLRVLRPEHLISDARENFFKVNFHLKGQGTLSQYGRTAMLQPGDWVIYDNTRPYELHFHSDYQQLLFLVPRAKLLNQLPTIDTLMAQPLPSQQGVGKVLLDLVRSALHESDALSKATANHMAQMLLDLLILGCGEQVESLAALPIHSQTRLTQVKQFIEAELQNPSLSADMIADNLHLSKRHLYTLFSEADLAVDRYIWQRRLTQCKQALADPRQAHLSISQIAFRWGFSSSAHFSRAFKKETGLSPRLFRQEMFCGQI